MSGPLKGVRVLDLTRVLAGPYCTMMLGDMGADVIKVEPPGGDETRKWGPPWLGDQSAYYLSCNRNKRSIVIDLRQEDGRQVIRQLAASVDVLIENFKLGTMERWDLGYEETLRPTNPRLIYCSISGFGRTGPYADLPGYDFVVQGMAGLMSITGEAGGDPTKVGVAVTDLTTGMMAAFSITAALRHRDQTGQGQRVDLSLLETQVGWLANAASNFLVSGQAPRPMGNAHPNIVPYQVFRARDQQMVVAAASDQQFARLCEVVSAPDLAQDPRFATNAARVAHRDELVPLLEQLFQASDTADWMARLQQRGIPCGPINSLDQVFSDPQVQHREMVQTVPHPTLGKVPQVGIPVKFGTTPGSIRRHPPLLGEHTREILAEAGFPPGAIDDLVASGAVVTLSEKGS